MIVSTSTATMTKDSPPTSGERVHRRKDLTEDEISQISSMSKPSDLDPAEAKTNISQPNKLQT